MTGIARLRLPALLLAALATLLLVVPAGPAAAHADFVSSDPADGAILDTPPAQITLTFSEDLLPGANTVAVTDATGAVIASEPIEPQGASVALPWPAGADGGTYRVAYRVVSADGHPITGSVLITVGRSSPEPVPAAAQDTEPESGIIANAFVNAVVVVVLVLIAAVIIVMIRRRSL